MSRKKRDDPEFDPPRDEDFVPLSSVLPPATDAVHEPVVPHALLSGRSAQEILAKITKGDPLWIRGRCDVRMRARAIMISPSRLTAKTLAHVAIAARKYPGHPPFAEWAAHQVDRAIDEALYEDRLGLAEPDDHDFASKTWNVDRKTARQGVAAFNGLPDAVRRHYWDAVIEGKAMSRVAQDCGTTQQLVEASIRRALLAITTLGATERLFGGKPDDE
jgi:hypothetical protein